MFELKIFKLILSRDKSDWKAYIDWLPQLGDLGNLPHNWCEDKNELKRLIGLDDQVEVKS